MADNSDGARRNSRRRRARRRATALRVLMIIVLLALCVGAVWYILNMENIRKHSAGNSGTDVTETSVDDGAVSDGGAAATDGTDAADSAEGAEAAAGDGAAGDAAAAVNKGSERIFAYKGTEDAEKNTLAAFDGAVKAGAGYIVLEMVVSADGTPYVAGDDYAVDMTGIKGYFSGMTDSQIDALTTRGGNKVVKLADVFDKYGDSVDYVVEIRYTAKRDFEAFIKLIKDKGLEDRVIVQCLYYDVLKRIEKSFPDMRKLYLCQDQAGFNVGKGLDYVDILSVDKSYMTEGYCKEAHDSGKKFNVRTLNAEEDIRKAYEIGADSFFTENAKVAATVGAE